VPKGSLDAGAATHAPLRGWVETQPREPHGGEWLPQRGTGRGIKKAHRNIPEPLGEVFLFFSSLCLAKNLIVA